MTAENFGRCWMFPWVGMSQHHSSTGMRAARDCVGSVKWEMLLAPVKFNHQFVEFVIQCELIIVTALRILHTMIPQRDRQHRQVCSRGNHSSYSRIWIWFLSSIIFDPISAWVFPTELGNIARIRVPLTHCFLVHQNWSSQCYFPMMHPHYHQQSRTVNAPAQRIGQGNSHQSGESSGPARASFLSSRPREGPSFTPRRASVFPGHPPVSSPNMLANVV